VYKNLNQARKNVHAALETGGAPLADLTSKPSSRAAPGQDRGLDQAAGQGGVRLKKKMQCSGIILRIHVMQVFSFVDAFYVFRFCLGISTVVVGLIKVWEPAQEKKREWVKQV